MRSNAVLTFSLIVLLFNLPVIGSAQKIIAKFNNDANSIAITREGDKNAPADTLMVFYVDGKSEKPYSLNAKNMDEKKLGKKHLEGKNTEFSFAADGKVIFKKNSSRDMYFCKDRKVFAVVPCADVAATNDPPKPTPEKDEKITSDFPFAPRFSPKSDSTPGIFPDDSKGYYHLVIDADADLSRKKNNTLYVKTLKNNTAAYKIAKWFKVNSSLSIFIRNYNFSNLVDIKIAVNGNDYHYEHALNSLYSQVVDSTLKGKAATDTGSTSVAQKGDEFLQVIKNNLEWANNYLNGYTSLNINDIVLLNQYKTALSAFYLAHSAIFDKAAFDLLSQILTWYPQLVSLTPIALTVPDNDEVEIELKISEKNVSEKKYNVGSYRVKNGASVIAGAKGSLFFTNLRNKDAYIDSSDHQAKLDTKHCLSIGIGTAESYLFVPALLIRPPLISAFLYLLMKIFLHLDRLVPALIMAQKKWA